MVSIVSPPVSNSKASLLAFLKPELRDSFSKRFTSRKNPGRMRDAVSLAAQNAEDFSHNAYVLIFNARTDTSEDIVFHVIQYFFVCQVFPRILNAFDFFPLNFLFDFRKAHGFFLPSKKHLAGAGCFYSSSRMDSHINPSSVGL